MPTILHTPLNDTLTIWDSTGVDKYNQPTYSRSQVDSFIVEGERRVIQRVNDQSVSTTCALIQPDDVPSLRSMAVEGASSESDPRTANAYEIQLIEKVTDENGNLLGYWLWL